MPPSLPKEILFEVFSYIDMIYIFEKIYDINYTIAKTYDDPYIKLRRSSAVSLREYIRKQKLIQAYVDQMCMYLNFTNTCLDFCTISARDLLILKKEDKQYFMCEKLKEKEDF